MSIPSAPPHAAAALVRQMAYRGSYTAVELADLVDLDVPDVVEALDWLALHGFVERSLVKAHRERSVVWAIGAPRRVAEVIA